MAEKFKREIGIFKGLYMQRPNASKEELTAVLDEQNRLAEFKSKETTKLYHSWLRTVRSSSSVLKERALSAIYDLNHESWRITHKKILNLQSRIDGKQTKTRA